MSHSRWPEAGRKIKIEPTATLPSPAFDASFPRVRGLDLAEPGPRNSMEQTWRTGTFAPRGIEIFDLRGTYVVDECLVLDSQLRVLTNVSDEYSDEEIDRGIEAIRRQTEIERLPHYDRTTVLVKRRAAANYGHFLMEMLPIAHFGRMVAQTDRFWFLIHRDVPSATMDAVLRAMRLLGIQLKDLLVQGYGEPVFLDRLLVLRGVTRHGRYMSPLAPLAAQQIEMRALEAAPAAETLPSRLFVRRIPGWNAGRPLHNEAEVAARLSRLGFVGVEPGTMSLEEQIRTFHAADHVVGVGGAAMTNIVFCREGTKVTMLWPASFPDTFYWFIATHRRLNYFELRCQQTVTEGKDSWNGGFTLSEADIQYLEAVRTLIA